MRLSRSQSRPGRDVVTTDRALQLSGATVLLKKVEMWRSGQVIQDEMPFVVKPCNLSGA
jgi:hypothetical protein